VNEPSTPSGPSSVTTPRPVAVVTGAARGIGLETARRLSATHRVALLDLDADLLEEAVAEIGNESISLTCDVVDQVSVDAAVTAVVEHFGRIDVAISNAGIGSAGTARHLDPAALSTQLEVNLTGAWRFLHACLPHVTETRGYLLGVASAAAIMGPPGESFYAASKAGLEALLDTVRVEVAHLGVGVGVAYLIFIDTPMVREGDAQHPDLAMMRKRLPGPAGRMHSVAEAAQALVDAVTGRRNQVFVPTSLRGQYWLRSIIRPLLDRKLRQMAPEVDALTERKVAQRGAYEAAFGARELAADQDRR
jgi:NAD(P)-dependent dehydrogenase (short-subunit alcohol dehydrogenase family)